MIRELFPSGAKCPKTAQQRYRQKHNHGGQTLCADLGLQSGIEQYRRDAEFEHKPLDTADLLRCESFIFTDKKAKTNTDQNRNHSLQ